MLLARVRAPARRPDPGLRLLRRGRGLANPTLRPLLSRGRQPARSPGRLYRYAPSRPRAHRDAPHLGQDLAFVEPEEPCLLGAPGVLDQVVRPVLLAAQVISRSSLKPTHMDIVAITFSKRTPSRRAGIRRPASAAGTGEDRVRSRNQDSGTRSPSTTEPLRTLSSRPGHQPPQRRCQAQRAPGRGWCHSCRRALSGGR